MGLVDISNKAKSAYHGGGHGFYQSLGGQSGHRDVTERDDLVRDCLKDKGDKFSILDVGCNMGASLHRAIDDGIGLEGQVFGVDVNSTIIECATEAATEMDKNIKFGCFNLNNCTEEQLKPWMGVDKIDVIYLYSVWDYFGVSAPVCGLEANQSNAINVIKSLDPKYIMFEGHADGTTRIENDVIENGKTYESWKSVFKNKLNVKHELIGLTHDNHRPLFFCEV